MPWYATVGIIYFVLGLTLGVMTVRTGHWIMFLLGFVFPWLVGAMMPPTRRAPLA
jgi:hypothetical protein